MTIVLFWLRSIIYHEYSLCTFCITVVFQLSISLPFLYDSFIIDLFGHHRYNYSVFYLKFRFTS